jgi:hypothetical protein
MMGPKALLKRLQTNRLGIASDLFVSTIKRGSNTVLGSGSAPFPQLLPHLNERLDLFRTGKTAIN